MTQRTDAITKRPVNKAHAAVGSTAVYFTGRPNAEVATRDADFVSAFNAAGVKPTKRQAGKFQRKTGAAYKGAR